MYNYDTKVQYPMHQCPDILYVMQTPKKRPIAERRLNSCAWSRKYE